MNRSLYLPLQQRKSLFYSRYCNINNSVHSLILRSSIQDIFSANLPIEYPRKIPGRARGQNVSPECLSGLSFQDTRVFRFLCHTVQMYYRMSIRKVQLLMSVRQFRGCTQPPGLKAVNSRLLSAENRECCLPPRDSAVSEPNMPERLCPLRRR